MQTLCGTSTHDWAGGGIGIRVRLRCVSRKGWRFESSSAHRVQACPEFIEGFESCPRHTKMSVDKLDTKVYVGQKAFIEKDGKILVLRDRSTMVKGQSGLDLPGGKYRWGKPLESELKREIKEETGLDIEIGRPFAVWTTKGIKRKGSVAHIVLVGFMCKYKGGKLQLSDEHDYYEWVDKNTYKKWRENTDYFRVLKDYFERGTGT